MVIYGMAMTPITKSLQSTLPAILQAWYVDDSAFSSMTHKIAAAMQLILAKGLACGYYPKPSKSILICNPTMHVMVWHKLDHFHFQYEDGYCHVGSFIGTMEAKHQWLQPQIQQWILGIK